MPGKHIEEQRALERKVSNISKDVRNIGKYLNGDYHEWLRKQIKER